MANKKSASKMYLRILGIIAIVMGALAVVASIIIMCVSSIEITSIIGASGLAEFRKANMDDNAIRITLGAMTLVLSLIGVLEGALMLRAARHPEKSTFLLVLLVLSVISGAFSLFADGFSTMSTVVANIISLAINVLALIATLNIRSEVK